MGWLKVGEDEGGDQAERTLAVSRSQTPGGSVNHHEEVSVKSTSH